MSEELALIRSVKGPLHDACTECDGAIRGGSIAIAGDTPRADLSQLAVLLADVRAREAAAARADSEREAASAAMRDLEGLQEEELQLADAADELQLRLAKAQRHNQPEEIQRLLERRRNSTRFGGDAAARGGCAAGLRQPTLLAHYPEMRRLLAIKAGADRSEAAAAASSTRRRRASTLRSCARSARRPACGGSAPSRRGGGRLEIASSLCRATPPSKPPTRSSARSNRRCSRSLADLLRCYAASHHAGGNATPRRRLPRAVGRRVPRRRRGGGGRHWRPPSPLAPALAAAYLHRLGVSHRALPAAILSRPDGSLALTDVGFPNGGTAGPYTAPELIHDAAAATAPAAADSYSLGVIVAELLSGATLGGMRAWGASRMLRPRCRSRRRAPPTARRRTRGPLRGRASARCVSPRRRLLSPPLPPSALPTLSRRRSARRAPRSPRRRRRPHGCAPRRTRRLRRRRRHASVALVGSDHPRARRRRRRPPRRLRRRRRRRHGRRRPRSLPVAAPASGGGGGGGGGATHHRPRRRRRVARRGCTERGGDADGGGRPKVGASFRRHAAGGAPNLSGLRAAGCGRRLQRRCAPRGRREGRRRVAALPGPLAAAKEAQLEALGSC